MFSKLQSWLIGIGVLISAIGLIFFKGYNKGIAIQKAKHEKTRKKIKKKVKEAEKEAREKAEVISNEIDNHIDDGDVFEWMRNDKS